MTHPAQRYRYKPLPVVAPDPSWKAFCATVEERIEAIRLEDADPFCLTCGSVAPKRVARKRCFECQVMLPVTAFSRNRTRRDGRNEACRPCHNARRHRNRVQQVLRGIGRVS